MFFSVRRRRRRSLPPCSFLPNNPPGQLRTSRTLFSTRKPSWARPRRGFLPSSNLSLSSEVSSRASLGPVAGRSASRVSQQSSPSVLVPPGPLSLLQQTNSLSTSTTSAQSSPELFSLSSAAPSRPPSLPTLSSVVTRGLRGGPVPPMLQHRASLSQPLPSIWDPPTPTSDSPPRPVFHLRSLEASDQSRETCMSTR